jgi:molecular chaperone GrpE
MSDVPDGDVEDVLDAAHEDMPRPSAEELVADLERVTAERDEYLGLAQRSQADLDNFRKRMMKQQADEVARASGRLVESLLPVLDAFDYGVAHGDESLLPMREQLLGALERQGLVRLDPAGEAFDPNEHDAVAHEPDEGGDHVVAETLRAGYRWQGQLLRPAMVRTKD